MKRHLFEGKTPITRESVAESDLMHSFGLSLFFVVMYTSVLGNWLRRFQAFSN